MRVKLSDVSTPHISSYIVFFCFKVNLSWSDTIYRNMHEHILYFEQLIWTLKSFQFPIWDTENVTLPKINIAPQNDGFQ